MITLTHKVSRVFNVSSTSGIHTDSELITAEKDGVTFSLYVSSLVSGSSLEVAIYEIGDSDGNETKIAEFPRIISKQAPLNIAVPAGGTLRVDATYSGNLSFEMRAKAINDFTLFNAAPTEKEVADDLALQTFRDAHLTNQECIIDLLETILNHQRFITAVNTDAGDKF